MSAAAKTAMVLVILVTRCSASVSGKCVFFLQVLNLKPGSVTNNVMYVLSQEFGCIRPRLSLYLHAADFLNVIDVQNRSLLDKLLLHAQYLNSNGTGGMFHFHSVNRYFELNHIGKLELAN